VIGASSHDSKEPVEEGKLRGGISITAIREGYSTNRYQPPKRPSDIPGEFSLTTLTRP
jgi:hypothetical protein